MRWIGTGAAVAVAIYVTNNASFLWFLLIPAVVEVLAFASQYTEAE